jgi:phosphoribosylamine--glycine ligase
VDVLIVGGGGREHALAWKAAQSPRIGTVLVAPGNAGTAAEPGVENVALSVDDHDDLIGFVRDRHIALTIIGPEAPLVAGIVDDFEAAGLRCFGPHKAAAAIEGSKRFCKDFMARHDIPTAAYASFDNLQPALDYLAAQTYPLVVKAAGLAAGKGVVIARHQQQAEQALRAMLNEGAFGSAGSEVVIEEFLHGEEASFICITDGTTIVPLASSQDHKARDRGDQGPNTGGMGAYSPAPVVTAAIHRRIMDEVIAPTVAGMAAEQRRYQGFLYAGLMIAADGTPKVLEFNCRFGDPETQPILMRLRSDLVDACLATLDGRLADVNLEWDPRAALGVVLAAGGYPADYRKGDIISGLEGDRPGQTKTFHAGTVAEDGVVKTNGGRVLCTCALGRSVAEAQRIAYERVTEIHWDGMFYRDDIGYRAVARETRHDG